MRPYFVKVGKFEDGRVKIAIEWLFDRKPKRKYLPKPERLLEILELMSLKEKEVQNH